ncbi:putative guanyl-specific ribonuclease f1 [Golovinomyces cichoracearum]|uniref:Putative guanyl-specific ribonuclease f1 n=1 Tax=Golovinomyces cichoracearum TaxID=62708 RepID=A0A420IGK8_9PEZI|nr:putative guanyl-specific ribonuclease f1 [Golovinomyces cichoracearum]
MRYFLAFAVILYAKLPQVVSVAPTPTARDDGPGFTCQYEFISDAEVKNSLLISKMKLRKVPSPIQYEGPLHEYREHLAYPVLAHEKSGAAQINVLDYFVVYKDPGHVVGVFELTRLNKRISCRRRNNPLHTQSSSDPTLSLVHTSGAIVGFQCGVHLIDVQLIKEKLLFALGRIRKREDALTPFTGTIPGSKGSHLMWSMVDKEHPSSTEESEALGACYLLTDEFGSFVQVSFRLLNGEYYRCAVKIDSNALIPTSRTTNRKNLQGGFLCDIFFDDGYLSSSRQLAQTRNQRQLKYPLRQRWKKMGEVLLWPIVPSKKVHAPAHTVRYYLVMSEKYEILKVVKFFKSKNHFKDCPRVTIDMTQDPENCDFICRDARVSIANLNEMVRVACGNILENVNYPKIYQGPAFDVSGPYLVSRPEVFIGNMFGLKYRAVITHDCKLAGVLCGTRNSLEKCLRDDRSTPGGPSNDLIFELSRDLNHVARFET